VTFQFLFYFLILAHLMPEHLENAIVNNDYHYVEQRLNQFDPVPANCVNEAFQTGLMIACQHKSFETVNVFLIKSTPVENDDPSFCNGNLADASGWRALHYAAQSGSLKCVKLLTEYKAKIDATTNKNETALFMATKHNHPDIVAFLAENNCHLQAKALYKKKPEKYSWRTEREEEFTALEVAVQHNFVETAKCLLFHLNRIKGLNEKELNELLLKAAGKDHTKIAHELVINGANVNYNGGSI
jgi:ankyrin repeat protein